MKKFLIDLGIILDGEYNDRGDYVIIIPDSDTFSDILALLIQSVMLEEVDSSSTTSGSVVTFESVKYSIMLSCDFDADVYRLICSLK